MAELKTTQNDKSVKSFLNSVIDENKRKDCREIMKLMQDITHKKPKMWGDSIVGFGSYHYKYESGREGDFFITGFSPRKQNLTIYIMPGFSGYDSVMKKLGKHKTGKSCLYIKKLDDIDRNTLKELITDSVNYMTKSYPCK
jgi:hypothetical protein